MQSAFYSFIQQNAAPKAARATFTDLFSSEAVSKRCVGLFSKMQSTYKHNGKSILSFRQYDSLVLEDFFSYMWLLPWHDFPYKSWHDFNPYSKGYMSTSFFTVVCELLVQNIQFKQEKVRISKRNSAFWENSVEESGPQELNAKPNAYSVGTQGKLVIKILFIMWTQ